MFRHGRGSLGWVAAVFLLAATACQTPTMSGSPGPVTGPAPTSGSPSTYLDSPTGWGPTQREWLAAKSAVSRLSDRALAGQVIVAAYSGTTAPVALVERYHLGGVIVQGENISDSASLISMNERLQAAVHRGWPLVISTDQEGGIVQRVGPPLTQFPTFMSYGAAGEPTLTRAAARASGEELRAVGFTLVFAPDADVTIGPSDPTIGSRSAGADPAQVATHAVAATLGYQQSGIVSVIKHFPGHGSVTTDSHLALPVQDNSLAGLESRDFVPFRAAVQAGAESVMVGHIALTAVDPGVPADLSSTDISLLTSDLGFRGLVVTDALNMAAVTDTMSAGVAAVHALRAGADLLLMPADLPAAHGAIVRGLRDGTLPRTRVQDAAAKIVALMMHEQHQRAVGVAEIGTHESLSQQVSAQALTVVSGACSGPYVAGTVTPEGDPTAVADFSGAASSAGLVVGPGGTTVALLAYGDGPADADVVVSLDTPYVLADSRAAVARLALFGADRAAMRALIEVLTGRATPTGRLPVSVDGIDKQRLC